MAHFAQLAGDTVVQVIVVSNDDCGNLEFPASEQLGKDFISSIGLQGEWKQTSYNNNFRGRYAGIGFRYDSQLDEFVEPVYPDTSLPVANPEEQLGK